MQVLLFKAVSISCLFMLAFGIAQPRNLGAQTTNTVTASQLQGAGQQLKLYLNFSLGASATPNINYWIGKATAPGANLINYKIYTVADVNTPRVAFTDVTAQYIDLSGPKVACIDPTPCPGNVFQIDAFSQDVLIPLKRPLSSNTFYQVELTDSISNHLEAQVNLATSLLSPDPTHVRNTVKIVSNINLQDVYPEGAVTVVYTPGVGAPIIIPVQVVGPTPTDGLLLKLTQPLPAGTTNSLQVAVKGITDRSNPPNPVSISGTLSSAAIAPTDLTKAFISVQLSAIAAVHSSPILSATGAFAPFHAARTKIVLPGQIHFDPAVNFDTGSASAKTTNSVTLPSQFIRPFVLFNHDASILPGALGSARPANVAVVNPMFGPRAEFDTQYGGVNLMGEGRLEFYLCQLYQTSSIKSASITAANPSIRSTLNLPTRGFSVTPYFQYDGGGHLNAQMITNTTAGQPDVSVPTYAISRIYLGTQATLQYSRNTVTIDGSWVDLFRGETVTFSENNILASRIISGLHPHAKGTYSINIDPENHFAGTITWENGRSSPSFAYLNKVSVGLQVTY